MKGTKLSRRLNDKHHKAEDAKCDEAICKIQKMRAAADAHCIGNAAATKRFSSILGTAEPKP